MTNSKKAVILDNKRSDRRKFLKASAFGISTIATGFLPFCSGHAASPRPGGRIRVGLGHGSTTDSLDPAAVGSNGFMGVLNYANHNHLCDVGNSGALEPELAETWEGSEGSKVWTFKLRKGVEFHNGKTLNSQDVVASINYHRGEDSKSPGKALLSDVVSVKADGPNVVTFHLKSGNADFPFIISDQNFMILPSKDGQINWMDRVASGPFVMQEFEPGVRAFLTKNPNYFKEGRPYFDELELLTIADPVARTNALTSGIVDLIDRVQLSTAHLLERVKSVRLEETNGMLHYTLPMLSDMSPFDNNDVRLALKYAVDREQMVQKILFGHGSVGNDHPISKVNQFHASDLAQRQYDPDKAKFHLKRAGLDSLSVPIHVSDAAFAGAVDAGVLYQNDAAKAGININVIREPNDGYWSNVWLKKPWCASYWLGRVSTDATFQLGYAANADWNESHFQNKRFNQLLTGARAELDNSKRRQMYQDMQQILNEDGGSVIPMFGNYVFASSTKLEHGEMRGDRDLDGQKFSERWWFA